MSIAVALQAIFVMLDQRLIIGSIHASVVANRDEFDNRQSLSGHSGARYAGKNFVLADAEAVRRA